MDLLRPGAPAAVTRGGRAIAVLAIALAMAGCDILVPQACTLILAPAISVEVLDSISGEPVRPCHVRTVELTARLQPS